MNRIEASNVFLAWAAILLTGQLARLAVAGSGHPILGTRKARSRCKRGQDNSRLYARLAGGRNLTEVVC